MKSIIIWGEEGDENSHINEIIAGKKRAFCTPELWFGRIDGEPETSKGDKLILRDPSGRDRILVEIEEINHIKFGEVDEKLAKDVLDCELQDFRDAHRFYWGEDIEVTDDLPIVTEHFKICEVYR